MVVTAEFVNYMLALLIYSVRYAAVYWYTSATFSAVFTAALLLTSLHYVYAYCGMQILYKFAVSLPHSPQSSHVRWNTRAFWIRLEKMHCFVRRETSENQ